VKLNDLVVVLSWGYPIVDRSSRRIDKREEGVERAVQVLGQAEAFSDSLDPSRLLLSGARVDTRRTTSPPPSPGSGVGGMHGCWCSAAYHAGSGRGNSRMDSSPVATKGKGAGNFSGPLSDPIIESPSIMMNRTHRCYRRGTKNKRKSLGLPHLLVLLCFGLVDCPGTHRSTYHYHSPHSTGAEKTNT